MKEKEIVVKKTTAKYACGHECEINLSGGKKSCRKKKLQRKLEKSPCHECYSKPA